MNFENRSAGKKRRRAREAALGSPPMMRRRRKRGAVDGGEDATATAAIEHYNRVDDIASDDEGDAASCLKTNGDNCNVMVVLMMLTMMRVTLSPA